jgi:ABC-type multidrug transport system fused ATPase/permease subunit
MGHGRIDFQNVSYSYNNTVVLDNINLTVEAGQKVGIIGPSGSGKSTLLKFLPLFIEPNLGRIMIDNIDIQTVSLQELRQRIAWISQTPQLFGGTIVENLKDGNVYKEVSLPEIEQAITVANVKEFTDRMPMGVDSPAGEGGNSLSGGQKQRIAIARGLLKNAPVVCMDEPTAALDSKSENFIRDSIAQLVNGKTVLMVTHRKALLSLMDKIYVLDSGKLRDVKDYGGLDAYLQKITDTEANEPKGSSADSQVSEMEQDKIIAEQQRLAELEAENAQLQERLTEASQIPPTAPNDGTVYINH